MMLEQLVFRDSLMRSSGKMVTKSMNLVYHRSFLRHSLMLKRQTGEKTLIPKKQLDAAWEGVPWMPIQPESKQPLQRQRTSS